MSDERDSSGRERRRNLVLLRGLLLVAVGGIVLDAGGGRAGASPLILLLVFVVSDLVLSMVPVRIVQSFRFDLIIGGADLVLVALGILLADASRGALPVSCLLMVLVVALGNHRLHAIAGATAVSALHAWFLLGPAASGALGWQFALQILFLSSVGLYYGFLVEGLHRLRRLQDAENLSRQELMTLLEILDAVASSLDLRQVAGTIVSKLTDIVPATRCSILLVDESNERCFVLASHDTPGLRMLEVDLKKYPEVRQAIETRNPVLIEDVRRDPLLAEVRETLMRLEFDSIMVQPLTFADDVLGTLCIKAVRSQREFSERELQFCGAVARASANALKNALMHRQISDESARQRRTGRKLAGILEHSPDLILTTDREGHITEFNRGAELLLGHRREDVLGVSCSALFESASDDGLVRQALDRGPIKQHDCRLRAGGGVVDVELNVAVLRDEEDHAIGTVWVGRDVRELKSAHMQLLQAEKLSAIGEVISGVAHELNNPLSGVLGFSQLILARSESTDISHDLEKVYESALRCQKIVKNLLAFARGHQPEKRYLGVNGIIEKTLDLKAYQLQVKDIEVRTELEPELPRTMLDFHQMQQVILNMINNAEHAMVAGRGGSGRLSIRTSSHDGTIRIEISDTGTGIDEATLERIFDPFFTTKAKGEGTGLGLSVSYGIVREHGGTIYARSEPGKGTSFIIELPVCGSAPVEDSLPVHATCEPCAQTATGSRILVVDDEPMILDLMIDILSEVGHRVDSAGNGGEAHRKITAQKYDLVVTDLRMPQMNGMELYREILAHQPQMRGRVIFLSGDLIDKETVSFLEETGARAVAKPIDVTEVISTVSSTLAAAGRLSATPLSVAE